MAPSVDASKEASLSLSSKQLRAELLLPFLSHDFTELQGRLDTDMRLTIDPNGTAVRPDGIVSLRDATFQLASAGGEFHDARATLTATPDGLVHLRDASAKGVTGEIQAAATARFTAGVFSGARAVAQVSKLQPLPLVVDGVQVGVFDGQMTLAVDPAKNASDLDVKVDVPTAHVELPQASTHDVQTLDELPGMRIGYELPGQGWVSLQNKSDDSAAVTAKARRRVLHVVVRLGNDVEVKRGSDLDVRLEGAPTFTVEQAIRASGQIRLVRGTLDVQGKRFTIEDGSVTFEGDATNPQVKLRASWQAPDGTIIYASFVGPLKTGSVTLSSDPTRTQTEILSLVLFGTADQGQQAATATGSSTQAYGAAGAAGGAATAPINRALGGVNQMLDSFGFAGGISTKIDTSQTTPRPEVEVQIARDISLQVAWVLGAISPGSNPDTTLFTLDWRFLRNLSLAATVGDAGTSILDLVWQHRY
jgi:translocation and assembly module TamB